MFYHGFYKLSKLIAKELSTTRPCEVLRRPRQLLLQLSREDLRAELFIQLPVSFPLRPAQAEVPEKMLMMADCYRKLFTEVFKG
eukprot:s140_g28.t1